MNTFTHRNCVTSSSNNYRTHYNGGINPILCLEVDFHQLSTASSVAHSQNKNTTVIFCFNKTNNETKVLRVLDNELERIKLVDKVNNFGELLVNVKTNCLEFLQKLPKDITLPSVYKSEDGSEITLEWRIGENKHLVLTIDGDNEYGYAMLINGKFVAAIEDGSISGEFPNDIHRYLVD